MKDRMRELNIKMTELSEYLKVSRPTLYKYIESYEAGSVKNLPPNVQTLFDYMSRFDVSKEQVISFAISSFNTADTDDSKDAIRKFIVDASDSNQKLNFIYRLVKSDCLDDLIPYLSNYIDIMSSGDIDDETIYQIARLAILKSNVTKNVPLKDDELRDAKKILGV